MSMPAEIYPIESIGAGRLAVCPQPASGGDADARIAEIASCGIGQVVSLLQADEACMLGLEGEGELVRAHGMRFVSFPIADMGLPDSAADFSALVQRLYRDLSGGVDTLIHCRGGIGRSGLLAAALLMRDGRDASDALARVSRMRGRQLPETAEQGAWLQANPALGERGGSA